MPIKKATKLLNLLAEPQQDSEKAKKPLVLYNQGLISVTYPVHRIKKPDLEKSDDEIENQVP